MLCRGRFAAAIPQPALLSQQLIFGSLLDCLISLHRVQIIVHIPHTALCSASGCAEAQLLHLLLALLALSEQLLCLPHHLALDLLPFLQLISVALCDDYTSRKTSIPAPRYFLTCLGLQESNALLYGGPVSNDKSPVREGHSSACHKQGALSDTAICNTRMCVKRLMPSLCHV